MFRRLIKNKFYQQVFEAEKRGASKEELQTLLGNRRAKPGIFDGDIEEGELEIGQISAAIKEIQSAEEVVKDLWESFSALKKIHVL